MDSVIDGVRIKILQINEDDRGNFREVLRETEQILPKIKQISLSTTKPGVIKAFHWHKFQDDIFHALQGNAQVVLYDGREDSPTKGKTQVILMGEDYGAKIIFIPRGVFHGYKVLEGKNLEMLYIMDNEYNPNEPDEQRVSFDDAEINFDWSIDYASRLGSKEKVLIIGSTGRLGEQLVKDFGRYYEVVGTYNRTSKGGLIHLDITDSDQVKLVIGKEDPDIVVIASAMTDIELCESRPDDALEVNVCGVSNIVENCSGRKVVFYSSDYVFDGEKKEYKEEDSPNPLNVYGKTKLEGERIVKTLPDHLIIRTSHLYGKKLENPKLVNKLIESLKEGRDVKLPVDFIAKPTLISDLSCATISLLKKNRTGIYHVAGKDFFSLYEIGIKIAEVFGFDKTLIIPIEKGIFSLEVKKPNCFLNTEKLEKDGINMSSFEDGLKQVMNYQRKYKDLKKCRICGSLDLIPYLDLGETALANSLVLKEEIPHEDKFRLRTVLCKSCGLSQIDMIVDQNFIFKNYVYRSSISKFFMNHCKELAEKLIQSNVINRNSLVVDIASNDGALLMPFKEFGVRILGVEPATNLAKIANDEGIETIESFWTNKLAEDILRSKGHAKIITSFNVFAHVHDIHEFMRGIKTLLAPDGFFIVEFPHHLHLMEKSEFDTIYHEHLSYFLVKPLQRLMRIHNMRIAKVEEFEIHGGSVRLYIEHRNGPERSDGSLQRILEKEEKAGLHNPETYLKFGAEVNKIKEELIKFLTDIKRRGKTIYGFGASAKGNTLLNYCNINYSLIDAIFDATPEKQNKLTPGTHIPIIHSDLLMKKKPDYLLLLAWNHAKEIMAKTKDYHDTGGKYIIPIPMVEVI